MDWVRLIADLIIPVLGLIFTVLAAPAIRESRWREYAETAVRAAEQIFGGKTGAAKYDFARKLLIRRFALSEQDAERLIESAVYELRRAGNALLGQEQGAGYADTDAIFPEDGDLGTDADGGHVRSGGASGEGADA